MKEVRWETGVRLLVEAAPPFLGGRQTGLATVSVGIGACIGLHCAEAGIKALS